MTWEGSTNSITVFLAGDNIIMREGVRAMLRYERDIEVVGVGEDHDTLVAGAMATAPGRLRVGRAPPDSGSAVAR